MSYVRDRFNHLGILTSSARQQNRDRFSGVTANIYPYLKSVVTEISNWIDDTTQQLKTQSEGDAWWVFQLNVGNSFKHFFDHRDSHYGFEGLVNFIDDFEKLSQFDFEAQKNKISWLKNQMEVMTETYNQMKVNFNQNQTPPLFDDVVFPKFETVSYSELGVVDLVTFEKLTGTQIYKKEDLNFHDLNDIFTQTLEQLESQYSEAIMQILPKHIHTYLQFRKNLMSSPDECLFRTLIFGKNSIFDDSLKIDFNTYLPIFEKLLKLKHDGFENLANNLAKGISDGENSDVFDYSKKGVLIVSNVLDVVSETMKSLNYLEELPPLFDKKLIDETLFEDLEKHDVSQLSSIFQHLKSKLDTRGFVKRAVDKILRKQYSFEDELLEFSEVSKSHDDARGIVSDFNIFLEHLSDLLNYTNLNRDFFFKEEDTRYSVILSEVENILDVSISCIGPATDSDGIWTYRDRKSVV